MLKYTFWMQYIFGAWLTLDFISISCSGDRCSEKPGIHFGNCMVLAEETSYEAGIQSNVAESCPIALGTVRAIFWTMTKSKLWDWSSLRFTWSRPILFNLYLFTNRNMCIKVKRITKTTQWVKLWICFMYNSIEFTLYFRKPFHIIQLKSRCYVALWIIASFKGYAYIYRRQSEQ